MRSLGLALILTLAACSAPGSVPSPSPSASTRNLDCADAIEPIATPPAGYTEVLAAVAVNANEQSEVSKGDEVYRLFAKTGLAVRAGQASTLSVTGRVAILWGNGARPWATTLKIPACPAKGGLDWLIYPGGFALDQPRCVPLIVQAGGERQAVPMPIGTTCPP